MKQPPIIPALGKEYVAPDEAKDTEAIIKTIISRLERDYPPGKTLRQFHAKMHGCVSATFTVLPDLPENFQFGFLIPGKRYKAWIRFSNGNTKVLDDRKADLRGMAVKLLDVPGEMLVDDKQIPQSQDFLLVSHPTLMSSTVKEFKKNIQALCGGPFAMLAFVVNPANWGTVIRTLQSMKKCNNVLANQYWSVSPYRLGKPEQAVKYSATPAIENISEKVVKDSNFLRREMQRCLTATPAHFNFMIQLQQDAQTMPVENACVEWNSEWIKVASIEIDIQQFDTPERDSFGENLNFSPWHCLQDHQPLGGISRARKAAYEAISTFRLKRNGK